MKRALTILALCAPAIAQVTVRGGERVRIAAPDATSAVSLDLHIAVPSLESGTLIILGVDAGDTRVIELEQDGIKELRVHVIAGRPIYPPGFVSPSERLNDAGSEEFRFSSDRLQFENILDLESHASQRAVQMHFASTTFAGDDGHRTVVPYAFYKITTANSQVTLLDDTVNSSDLTLNQVILRGFHLREGPWQFHAGYTDSADFANVFIPVEKEFAAGLGYTKTLTSAIKITPSVYLLRSVDIADGRQRSALIGSLRFEDEPSKYLKINAEVAYGRSPGYAGSLQYARTRTKAAAKILRKQSNFPSLRSSTLPGLATEVSLSEEMTKRLFFACEASLDKIDLPTVEQDSQNADARWTLKLSQSWGVGSGISYSAFTTAGTPSIRTRSLPQQISFDRRHFGLAMQYQISSQSNSLSNGSGFRPSFRLSAGHLEAGGFYDFQKDALGVGSLYSQIPELQQALQKLGLTSATPEQLTALIQEAEFLHTLGVANSTAIIAIPRRTQEGGNLSWSSRGRQPQQLSVAVIESQSNFTNSSSNDFNLSGTYSRHLGPNNQFQLTSSLVRTGVPGQERTMQVTSFSLKHFFATAPAMLSAQKTTSISGAVFVDARRIGVYEIGDEPVDHATVILDGERTTVTDAGGLFRFTRVSEGNHRVELVYEAKRPHYFTTPQSTVIAGGSSIDFGIAFPTTDLWGYVNDDVDNGLANIKLRCIGPSEVNLLSTDASGKFMLPDVKPGRYHIEVDPENLAAGYDTENLAPLEIVVSPSSVPHPIVRVAAIRVLTGVVTAYDPASGSYRPVQGAHVSIPQLGKAQTTGPSGKFTIDHLPPGELQVKVEVGASFFLHKISVPVHPVVLKDNFSISSIDGSISSSLGQKSGSR